MSLHTPSASNEAQFAPPSVSQTESMYALLDTALGEWWSESNGATSMLYDLHNRNIAPLLGRLHDTYHHYMQSGSTPDFPQMYLDHFLSAEIFRQHIEFYLTARRDKEQALMRSIESRYTLQPEQRSKIQSALSRLGPTGWREQMEHYRTNAKYCDREFLRSIFLNLSVLQTKAIGDIMRESKLDGVGLSTDPVAVSLVTQYLQHGGISEYHLDPLLSHVGFCALSDDARSSILEFFIPTLSISTLLQYGIWTERDLQDHARKISRSLYGVPATPESQVEEDHRISVWIGTVGSPGELRRRGVVSTEDVFGFRLNGNLFDHMTPRDIRGLLLESQVIDPNTETSQDIIDHGALFRAIQRMIVDDSGDCLIEGVEHLGKGSTIKWTKKIGENEITEYYILDELNHVISTYDDSSGQKRTIYGLKIRNFTEGFSGTREVEMTYDQFFAALQRSIEINKKYRDGYTVSGESGQAQHTLSVDRETREIPDVMTIQDFFVGLAQRDMERGDPDITLAQIDLKDMEQRYAIGNTFWIGKDKLNPSLGIIKNISGGTISFMDAYGVPYYGVPFQDFFEMMDQNQLSIRPAGPISTLDDFIGAIGDLGTFSKGATSEIVDTDGLSVNQHALQIKTAQHTDSKNTEATVEMKTVRCFEQSQGGQKWIEVEWGEDGTVQVYEYRGYGEMEKDRDGKEKFKAYKTIELPGEEGQKLRKKNRKGKGHHYYAYPKMSYAGLLQMMRETGYTIPSHQTPRDRRDDDMIKHQSHQHSAKKGLLMWLAESKMTNFASLSMAMKTGWHMIEHLLEDNEKSKANRALYKMMKWKYGAKHPMTIHAMMGFISDVGKIIKGKQEKIGSLAGVVKREEILHILKDASATPESIIAALLTAAKEGDLYYDTPLSYHSDSRLFFTRLVRSLGYDVIEERRIAEEKVLKDMTEAGGTIPSEHQMITVFMKRHQEHDPYIQAIGGGSHFWKSIAEGKKAGIAKGESEASERSSPEGRLKYVLAKIGSGEFDIAYGALTTLFGKDASAAKMVPGFLLTMGNAVNTLDTDMLNKFCNLYFEKAPFHAFAFIRNGNATRIYQGVLRMLADTGQIPARPGKKSPKTFLDEIEKLRGNGRVHSEKLYEVIHDFWEIYHTDLHPILQGVDPLMNIIASGKGTQAGGAAFDPSHVTLARAYLAQMNGLSGYIEKQDPQVLEYHGYNLSDGSLIYDQSEAHKEGKGEYHRSIDRILGHIHITEGAFGTNRFYENQIWDNQVLAYLDDLRDNPTFGEYPEYHREHFIRIYSEIVSWIQQKKSAHLAPRAFLEQLRNPKSMLGKLQSRYNFGLDDIFIETNGGDISWSSHNDPEELRQKISEKFTRFLGSSGSTRRTILHATNRVDHALGGIAANDNTYDI